MFVSIPAEKFRMDISSTELRKKQGGVDKRKRENAKEDVEQSSKWKK